MMKGNDLDFTALTAMMPLFDKRVLAEKVVDAVIEQRVSERSKYSRAFWDDAQDFVGKIQGVFDAIDALIVFSTKYTDGKQDTKGIEQYRDLYDAIKAVVAERREWWLTGVADE